MPFAFRDPLAAVAELLPQPFAWSRVDGGSVQLADFSNDTPKGTTGGLYKVGAFDIATYPITNAQFDVFLRDPNGFANREWWDFSKRAQSWRAVVVMANETNAPGDLIPRTMVSWYEAMAFCKWLSWKVSQQTGEAITFTLPTEQQWQFAAQGMDGRRFPWGDELQPEYANYNGNIGALTPITDYPAGASPFGVMGLCGNAWDWCRTEWNGDTHNITLDERRVVRGGSFVVGKNMVMTTFRFKFEPYMRHSRVSFRPIREG